MRLGDLDALKKAIDDYAEKRQDTLLWQADIEELIDNAPTVETDIEVVAKDAYEQGYTDGWKERFGEPDERPQGEWIPISEIPNDREYDDGFNAGYAEAIKNIPEYRKLADKLQRIQGDWISVSERLPDKNMPCLVSVGKLNFTKIAMYSDLMGTINHKIFWQGDYGKNNFQNITEYVKAWQPLPEPYKKGGAEE